MMESKEALKIRSAEIIMTTRSITRLWTNIRINIKFGE
jgi:hypothetical protein